MDRRLAAYLRRSLPGVGREQIAAALGISLATLARREVNGWDASEVITAARIFDLSPLRVLLDMGFLTQAEVTDHSERSVDEALLPFSDLQLVQEVVRRLEVLEIEEDAAPVMSIVPAPEEAELIGFATSELAPIHQLRPVSDRPGIISENDIDPAVWEEAAAADDPDGYTIEQEQEETEREP